MPERLDDNHAVVWYRRSSSLDDDQMATLGRLLSDAERERRDRMRFERDRRDYTAAHALLRQVLSRYGDVSPADWQFATGSHGKPRLDSAHPCRFAFNLSHTEGLVACAVTRQPEIGLDVERRTRVASVLDVATRFFTADEIDFLSRCGEVDRGERFLELWALKEAYVKALGLGLSAPPPSFACVYAGNAIVRQPTGLDGRWSWHFRLASVDDEACIAVAVAAETATPIRITFHDADSAAAVRVRWSWPPPAQSSDRDDR